MKRARANPAWRYCALSGKARRMIEKIWTRASHGLAASGSPSGGEETVMRLLLSGLLRCAFGFAFASAASAASAPKPEGAQFVARPAASFPQASKDYFHDMENGPPLNA